MLRHAKGIKMEYINPCTVRRYPGSFFTDIVIFKTFQEDSWIPRSPSTHLTPSRPTDDTSCIAAGGLSPTRKTTVVCPAATSIDGGAMVAPAAPCASPRVRGLLTWRLLRTEKRLTAAAERAPPTRKVYRVCRSSPRRRRRGGSGSGERNPGALRGLTMRLQLVAAVAAAFAVLAAAPARVHAAAAAIANHDLADSMTATKEKPSLTNTNTQEIPILKVVSSKIDISPPQKELSQSFEGQITSLEPSIPNKKDDNSAHEKYIVNEIREDLPPDVAVKAASRMIEEEAIRRKKFRNMMRSLVHSELPHLDPKLDYTPEESEETQMEEESPSPKMEEGISRAMSFAQVLPFMLSRTFFPLSPQRLFPGIPQNEPPSGSDPNTKKVVIINQLPSSSNDQSNQQGLRTIHDDPMMLFVPRRSMRIDMTFIPIHSKSHTRNSAFSGPLSSKESSKASEEKPHSLRVFSSSSSDSSPLTKFGPFPFSRLLDFFHNIDETIIENAKVVPEIEKQESVTRSPATVTTRRKREIEMAEETPERSQSTNNEAAAGDTGEAATAASTPAPAPSEDSKVEPRMLHTDDDDKEESSHVKGKLARHMMPAVDSFGVPGDPMRFHPYPFAAPEGFNFNMMPYIVSGAMFHDKMPVAGIWGLVPGAVPSGLEQQMIAMNQLAQEASHGGMGGIETMQHGLMVTPAPCLGPCRTIPGAIPMRTLPLTNREKRSINADSPFQQHFSGAHSYNAFQSFPLSRNSLTNSDPAARSMEDNDDFDVDSEPAVVQSKLLLKGEPEAIRKLNPQFRMTFGPEMERKEDAENNREESSRTGFARIDKPKTSPYSFKKLYYMNPEKKKSKKMLAAMETQGPPPPEPWGAPMIGVNPFASRMAPSLLGDSEIPVESEGLPFRGKRSISQVQFTNPEEDLHLAAYQDDLLNGEGSNNEYFANLRSDGRKSRRGKSRSKTRGKLIEEIVEYVLDKNKPNFIPWLDPTMMGDEHENHFHRSELGNDVKLSSYDH